MKALTLRHLDPDLARAIEREAREKGTSLSGAVLSLLEQATGISKKCKAPSHDLDRFFGAWSADEARDFDQALSRQRQIDPELWS